MNKSGSIDHSLIVYAQVGIILNTYNSRQRSDRSDLNCKNTIKR